MMKTLIMRTKKVSSLKKGREEKFLKGKTTFAHLVVKKACTWLLK